MSGEADVQRDVNERAHVCGPLGWEKTLGSPPRFGLPIVQYPIGDTVCRGCVAALAYTDLTVLSERDQFSAYCNDDL